MKNLLKNFILIFVVTFLGFFINSFSEDFITSLLRLLSGLVTSPGNQSISGVNVILTDSKGDFIDTIAVTKTNSDCTYTFNDPPPDPKRLFFEKGSFRNTLDIVIPATGNQTVSNAVVTSSKKLGYFFGERDSIQTFVSSFGYNSDRLNINQLSDT